MLTLNKTKAALQSCQCHCEKPKQNKHTRVSAGGQRMSQRNTAPADYIQFFSSSLAFLRWRRLISPLIEATTKPAVLSPSSFTFSSSPINSSGTLETICCDLLFLEPVAMSVFPSDWWHSVYAKRKHNQYLKVAFTLFYSKCMPPVMVKHKWQRPGVLGTTTEASNQKRYQR